MKSPQKLLLTAFLALACTARADLTLVQKIEQDGPKKTEMTVTTKIQGDKIRMDVNPQVSTIMDTKSGEMLTLMHPQKMVMEVPAAMVKGLQEQVKSKMADSKDAGTTAPTATGRKETINGYACEEYTFTSNGMKIDAWLTKDVEGADKIQQQLAALSGEADPFKGMLQDTKLEGFPIRTTMSSPNMGTTTVTIVGLNEDPVPASEFGVPKGYRKMQIPKIPGI